MWKAYSGLDNLEKKAKLLFVLSRWMFVLVYKSLSHNLWSGEVIVSRTLLYTVQGKLVCHLFECLPKTMHALHSKAHVKPVFLLK